MIAPRELPTYLFCKTAQALKIKAVTYTRPRASRRYRPRSAVTIETEETGYPAYVMDEGWATAHRPQPGGYLVVYEDGLMAYCPAPIFEANYARRDTARRPVTPDDVEEAIVAEYYFSGEDGVRGATEGAQGGVPEMACLLVCVLVLRGAEGRQGHLVTGEAMAQNVGRFDPERARSSARRRAFEKAFDYLVYRARCAE